MCRETATVGVVSMPHRVAEGLLSTVAAGPRQHPNVILVGRPPWEAALPGDHRLRIVVAELKACTGILALCWATAAFAQNAGTASSTLPHPAGRPNPAVESIRMLPSQPTLAGTCGGSTFNVNTFINVTAQASADVKVSAPGVGTIEEFTDETGNNIGPYNAAYSAFEIPAFGGGLAPNTSITILVTTYSGPALSGSITFVSSLEFNCTTGAVLQIDPPATAAIPTPTLSPLGLALTAALLVLLGIAMLRSQARPRRARR
jgi:hypothetical protein